MEFIVWLYYTSRIESILFFPYTSIGLLCTVIALMNICMEDYSIINAKFDISCCGKRP